MVTSKAFLVLLAFIVSALSLPVTLPSFLPPQVKQSLTTHFQLSTSDSAQVSCYASDPSASYTDLQVAVQDFCKHNFPSTYSAAGLSFGSNYDLIHGGTALVKVSLDANCTDMSFRTCETYLRQVVADCKINGQSTGGQYNPIETGASMFTVQVLAAGAETTDHTKRSDSDPFNAAESAHRSYSTTCNSFPTSEDPVTVGSDIAQRAKTDICKQLDGTILAKNQQKPLTVESLFANVIALENAQLNTDDCNFAYDTLFKACTWDGLYYGGQINTEPVKYVLELGPAGFNDEATAPVISARDKIISINSALTCRSSPDSSCHSHGWTLPKSQVYDAASRLCYENRDTRTWEAEQAVHDLCEYSHPPIEASFVARQHVENSNFFFCMNNFALSILRCSSSDLAVGGSMSAFGVEWSITPRPEALPRSNKARSTRDISIATRQEEPASGTCDEDNFWVPTLDAQNAATALCESLAGKLLAVNEIQSSSAPSSGYNIFLRIQAIQQVVLDEDLCLKGGFGFILWACTTNDGKFFGSGGYEKEKILFAIVIMEPGTADSTALVSRNAEADFCADGPPVDYLWAQAAASGMCGYITGTTLQAGDLKSKTFSFGQSRLIARAQALQTVTIDHALCHDQAFGYLISTCSKDGQFYGSAGAVVDNVFWSLKIGDDSSAPLVSRGDDPYNAHPMCVPLDGTSVKWYKAFSTTLEFCRSLSGKTVRPGFSTDEIYEVDEFGIQTQFVSDKIATIDQQKCLEMFDMVIKACGYPDYTSGGSVIWDGFTARFYVEKPKSTRTIESRADNAALLPRTPVPVKWPPGVRPMCVPVDETSVRDDEAYAAIWKFFGQLEGKVVEAGFQTDETYPTRELGIHIQLVSDDAATINADDCIRMLGVATATCAWEYTGDKYTSGATISWDGFLARFYVEKPVSTRAIESPTDTLDVLPRQATGCIRAESSPIDKQVAVEAIGDFCPRFSSQTLTKGELVTSTITAGGLNIGMKVAATGEEDYVLYAQYCYAGFMQLLNECSDGQEYASTNGGTLFTLDAAFTLSTVFV